MLWTYLLFVFKKKGSKTKIMKEDEIEKKKRRLQAANPKSFSEILSDLNQAVPNHLADKSQTC